MSLLRHLLKHGTSAGMDVTRVPQSPLKGIPLYVDFTGVVREDHELTSALELRALPPFDDVWIEWRDQNGGKITMGCRVTARRGEIDPRLTALRLDVFFAFNGRYRVTAALAGSTGVALNPDGSEVTSRDDLAPAAIEELGGSGPPGSPYRNRERSEEGETMLVRYFAPASPDPEGARVLEPFLRIAGNGVLEGYQLLNCENIALEPITDPEARRRAGRTKKKGLLWHRLVVVKPSLRQKYGLQVPRGSGEPIMRAHLRRGHFKTYTAEAPLLGKHVGRFWWSPHAAGSKELGVVLKDYEVRRDSDDSSA